jgi:hypothetical protein
MLLQGMMMRHVRLVLTVYMPRGAAVAAVPGSRKQRQCAGSNRSSSSSSSSSRVLMQ